MLEIISVLFLFMEAFLEKSLGINSALKSNENHYNMKLEFYDTWPILLWRLIMK